MGSSGFRRKIYRPEIEQAYRVAVKQGGVKNVRPGMLQNEGACSWHASYATAILREVGDLK